MISVRLTTMLKTLLDTWKDYQYRKHWQDNADRRHMRERIFPAVKSWLASNRGANLLDVGTRWYTRKNAQWLRAVESRYWVVDIESPPAELSCDAFVLCDLAQLPQRFPLLRGHFDIVISYGVLGAVPLPPDQIEAYLAASAQLLKSNGLFLLKLDPSRMDTFPSGWQVNESHYGRHFLPTEALGLPPTACVHCSEHNYLFLTLAPRPT